MSQITLAKLKEKCIREFCAKNTSYHAIVFSGGKVATAKLLEFQRTGKVKSMKAFIKQLEDECVETINAVDVRNLKPLIEMFPNSIPSWIKKGSYFIDEAEWTLVRLYGQKDLRYSAF